jgi:hypothetical protein
MGSKGLATSGKRWGLSCVVTDEAAMGVILGHMKLFGATDIGFDVIGPVRKPQGKKNPKAVEAGRKGGLARRRGTAERLPLLAAAEKALSEIAGHEFKTNTLVGMLERLGWAGTGQQNRAIQHLIETKRMKRKERGVYTKLPSLVKDAG